MTYTLKDLRTAASSLAPSSSAAAYSVTKTRSEDRYTLGVLYVPMARDYDDEWVDSDELQKSMWRYFGSGQRGVRDTHTKKVIGELVELITWPFPVEVDAPVPGEANVRKYQLPEGTVFAGVIWDEEAWPHVQSGKLRGYSLGGRAVRMKEAGADGELPKMADFQRR